MNFSMTGRGPSTRARTRPSLRFMTKPTVPNRARYQAALRPDATRFIVQGRRACTRSSGLPGVLADKLDEFAVAAKLGLHLAADLLHHGQGLVRDVPDRDHHAPALAELLEERRGDRGPAGRDKDPIEGRLVGPAERAAADADPHVVVAELLEERSGALGQARQALDGADAAGELGQHGGLIPGAGSDLQDLFRAAQLEQLRHEPDDVRLGDRLLLADRQRMVAVSAIAQRLLDEEMARHPSHRGEDALVGNPALHELLLDHPGAGRLVPVARPLHYPLRGFLFGAAAARRRGARPVSLRNWALSPPCQSFSCTSAR